MTDPDPIGDCAAACDAAARDADAVAATLASASYHAHAAYVAALAGSGDAGERRARAAAGLAHAAHKAAARAARAAGQARRDAALARQLISDARAAFVGALTVDDAEDRAAD